MLRFVFVVKNNIILAELLQNAAPNLSKATTGFSEETRRN
jgi:hypothetical protein